MEQQSQFRYTMSSYVQIHTPALKESDVPHHVPPALADVPRTVAGRGRGLWDAPLPRGHRLQVFLELPGLINELHVFFLGLSKTGKIKRNLRQTQQ